MANGALAPTVKATEITNWLKAEFELRSRSCHGDVCAVQRENGVGERTFHREILIR